MARGNTAPKANRPPDGVSNLHPGSTENGSNQLKLSGNPSKIKPTAVQNFGKRVNGVKLPANF